MASHQLTPGSPCVAGLPDANADAKAGKAAAGAEEEMKGQGLRGATATPADEMDDANAGHCCGSDVAGLSPGCRSYMSCRVGCDKVGLSWRGINSSRVPFCVHHKT